MKIKIRDYPPVKLSNLIAAIKAQGPLKRAFFNFCITKNAWGMFSIQSHFRDGDSTKPKVMYNRLESAKKAAQSMSIKHDKVFKAYKCIFCDGYHLGKNKV